MICEIPKFWAGSAESLDYVIVAHERAMEMAASGKSDIFEMPPLFQMHEGVAVLTIDGPMINGSAGFMRLFGVLGYDDVRQAVVDAMSTKGAEALLFDISSPGGSVAGLEELVNFVRETRNVMPSVSFTGGQMASAAYWLGTSAAKVFATKSALVGSIGAVMIHAEESKRLETQGVKATVIRSGKWKMLGNSVEPLSELAREDFQAKIDAVNGFFVEAVATNLGVSPKMVEEKMGQGRVFLGSQALELGMIHGITSFDDAVRVAKTLAAVDKRKR